jgi:Spy/CpxP family protein refolding chaperone
LRDLGVKLNLEQLEKMMELLTPEQLKTINERLDKEDGGYSTWF